MSEKTGDPVQDYIIGLDEELENEEERLDREDIEVQAKEVEKKKIDDAAEGLRDLVKQHFQGSVMPQFGDLDKLEDINRYIIHELKATGHEAEGHFHRILSRAKVHAANKHGLIDRVLMVIKDERENRTLFS